MAVLRYNGYYISVFHTPDRSGNSSCIPFVEIRQKRDHGPGTRLMLSEAFSTAQDASAHGFEMGKHWIDARLTKSKSPESGGIVAQVAHELQSIPLGFKTWLTSLLS
jgi:hypothetical protein